MGFSSIIAIVLTFSSGFFGIYLCNKIDFLKKNINLKNLVIISFIFIFYTSLFFGYEKVGVGLGRAIGYYLLPLFTALIYSLFKNKFRIKLILDEKFCYFLFGVLLYSVIMNTIIFASNGRF